MALSESEVAILVGAINEEYEARTGKMLSSFLLEELAEIAREEIADEVARSSFADPALTRPMQ